MDITFTCPHCGEVTLIGQEFVGQSGECRTCAAWVTVPSLVAGGGRSRYFGTTLEVIPPAAPANPFMVWLGWIAILAPLLCIVLLPLLPYAGSQGPSTRMQSQNNLKQIFLALKAYEDVHGQLPRPYWRNPQGKETLPWRVAILPYIEQQPLFDEYVACEPWDSQTNRRIGRQMVGVYWLPSTHDDADRRAGYMVLTGPGALFQEGKNLCFSDCILPPEETIVLLEVRDSTHDWYEPADLELIGAYLGMKAAEKHGGARAWQQGAEVAFADGSIRSLTREELSARLRAMYYSISSVNANAPPPSAGRQ